MLTVLLSGLLILPSCAATRPAEVSGSPAPVPGDTRKTVLAKWGRPDHRIFIPIDRPLDGYIVQWTYPERTTYVYMVRGKVISTNKMFK